MELDKRIWWNNTKATKENWVVHVIGKNRFTLDDDMSNSVLEQFIRLYEKRFNI